MKTKKLVRDWLRLERTLLGDPTTNPPDPGCSNVTAVKLGMGLAHCAANLRRELQAHVRDYMGKKYTPEMKMWDKAVKELHRSMGGSPMSMFELQLSKLRQEDRWAQAVADQAAYEAADEAALDEELEVELYVMDASKVLPGWGGNADAGSVPLKHLAVLYEFGILVEPEAKDA